MVSTGEGICPLHASLVLALLSWDVVKTVSVGVLVNIAQADPQGLAQRARLEARKQPAGDITEGKAGDGGIHSVSFQGNSWVNALHPSSQHVRLHPRLGVNKIFQTGCHTPANTRALLDKCEKVFPVQRQVSLCLAEEVIICTQLGRVARLVCVPEFIAHRLPCKWPGYPRIIIYRYTSQREHVGTCFCVTSEFEECTAAGVMVLRTGNCQR